jgi:hypothetical protein
VDAAAAEAAGVAGELDPGTIGPLVEVEVMEEREEDRATEAVLRTGGMVVVDMEEEEANLGGKRNQLVAVTMSLQRS